MREPATFGGAVLAANRPLPAEKRGDARHAVTGRQELANFGLSPLSGEEERS